MLGSRNDRPLTRYFPELVGAVQAGLPERCVVDGEIVVVTDDGLDFEALQQRIHPATSRINMLAGKTPASFVAFDLLALGDRDLCEEPFAERRRLLEQSMPAGGHPSVHITPVTDDPDVADDWFHRFEGAGFDGVMAKPADGAYQQDKRTMLKVKHQRTADAVVAGFRWHKDGKGIGSLLLGLYDGEGDLHNVGVATSFTAERRRPGRRGRPAAGGRARGSPVAGLGRGAGPRRQPAHAGNAQPLERGEGPDLGAAAPRAGGRGALRARPGRPLPPCLAPAAGATTRRPPSAPTSNSRPWPRRAVHHLRHPGRLTAAARRN